MSGEARRKAIHLAMTAFALALRWLEPWQACALAGAAILLNWALMPAFGWDRAIRREGEPFVDGVKTYPVAVLAALLLFPVPAAAAAWGAMGVGDACAGLVGRRFGRPGFLGRADRSGLGSFAFLVTAWPAAWALAQFAGRLPMDAVWLPALAAAAAGAAAEFAPFRRYVDDNLPIALAAGGAYAAVTAAAG